MCRTARPTLQKALHPDISRHTQDILLLFESKQATFVAKVRAACVASHESAYVSCRLRRHLPHLYLFFLHSLTDFLQADISCILVVLPFPKRIKYYYCRCVRVVCSVAL